MNASRIPVDLIIPRTFFRINIECTEPTWPSLGDVSRFLSDFNRLYVVLRIALDQDYDSESLLRPGYRLLNRDKLRTQNLSLASPLHLSLLLLAIPGAATALKWLVPIALDVYKTRRDDPKVIAETHKIEAEARKADAEARKADAEARKADAEAKKAQAETDKIVADNQTTALTTASAGQMVSGFVDQYFDELSLNRAEDLIKLPPLDFSTEEGIEELNTTLDDFAAHHAVVPLLRVLYRLKASSFRITQISVEAIELTEDARQEGTEV